MTAMSRILCPVDFSETSQHAVEHAIALARWSRGTIVAQHVYVPPFAPIPGLPRPELRMPDAARQRVSDEISAMFDEARADGIPVETAIDIGHPAQMIVDRAAAVHSDLVVIGTHGTGGFQHLVLGSVAERVLRQAHCPVLTVPPRAHATSELPFRRILCAVDFSEPSLAAWRFAQGIARGTGAHTILLHVIEWPWREPPAPRLDELPAEQAAALDEYRRYVDRTARVRLEGLIPPDADTPVSVQVADGRPYVEILRAALGGPADLIVMGVHGRSIPDLALFGSTANQVVRRATCPVMTLRS